MAFDLEVLFDTCKKAGVKVTQQRIEIYKTVMGMGNHPTANLVHENLKNRLPTVSLDTVYRNLWMLCDLGLINTLGTVRESTRFDGNLKPHHHFICDRCGFTDDIPFEIPNPIPSYILEKGSVEEIHVEVHGTCKKCMSS